MKSTALIMLLASLSGMAAPLTPDQALRRALEHDYATARSRSAEARYDYAGTHGSLYVFNRDGNNGFIITPSDPSMEPLLASVGSGNFDPEAMPEAMKWLLSLYDSSSAVTAAASTYSAPDYYLDWSAVEPIVKARWNQNSPYNDRCPVVYGSTAATGCVATAMAQIIYHHRYAKGSGSISYKLYNNTTQTFNFATAKFDFDAMTDTYDSSSSAAAKEAVAELMEACGKSVQMSYGPGESSAIPVNIPGALKQYFGYDSHTTICDRERYQTQQWETIIYNELCAGRPVLYSGNTEQGGGHAFVCDGYDGNGLFHINWGWGGMSDGYFSLTSLKPGQVGIGARPGGFNTVQQIVVIVPPGATYLPDTEVRTPEFPVDMTMTDVEISPLSTGNEATVKFTAVNRGSTDLYTVASRLLLFQPGASSPIAYGDEVRSYAVAAGDARCETFRIKLINDKGDAIPTGAYELHICDSNEKAICPDAIFDVNVTSDPVNNSGFTHTGQITIGDATTSVPAIIFKDKPLKLMPSIRNDNASTPVSIGFALFAPGSDKPVWASKLQTMTLQSTNGAYLGNFPYLNEFNLTDVPAGTYDAAFISTNNLVISERKRVNVAEVANGIACSVAADGKSACIVPFTYAGDVVIPDEVTLSDGRKLPVCTVEAETFLNNNDVTSVDFPATLTSLGLHSLRYMRNVKTLRFRSTTVPFVHIAVASYRMNPHVRIIVPANALDDYKAASTPFVPEPDSDDAITEIEPDSSARPDGPYYDLQGRRVASPRHGIIYVTPSGKVRL
ncbi:MAG: C10 family peptidase [Muribaculaceae bacterium]|nr:C10 family peptidase [Muribaculaceae bacterium]